MLLTRNSDKISIGKTLSQLPIGIIVLILPFFFVVNIDFLFEKNLDMNVFVKLYFLKPGIIQPKKFLLSLVLIIERTSSW